MHYAKLEAIEYVLPDNCLSNSDLHFINPDWNEQKIFNKVGIETRYVTSPEETALDLAENACKQLFDSGVCSRDEVDGLIFCTQTPDFLLPPNSPQLQHRVGLSRNLMAFDISHGCSGYIYSLGLAKSLIESGICTSVLAVTAETYSKHLHPDDHSVRTIFGDAAAVTLLRASPMEKPALSNFCFQTDGNGAKNLIIPKSGAKASSITNDMFSRALKDNNRTLENLIMNGPEIMTFSLQVVPKLVRETLEAASTSIEKMDAFIFHQANAMMLETLRQKCKIPEEKFLLFYSKIGNTVSSTIPIVLKKFITSGRLHEQHQIMLVGFGVGYSSAACLLQL